MAVFLQVETSRCSAADQMVLSQVLASEQDSPDQSERVTRRELATAIKLLEDRGARERERKVEALMQHLDARDQRLMGEAAFRFGYVEEDEEKDEGFFPTPGMPKPLQGARLDLLCAPAPISLSQRASDIKAQIDQDINRVVEKTKVELGGQNVPCAKLGTDRGSYFPPSNNRSSTKKSKRAHGMPE